MGAINRGDPDALAGFRHIDAINHRVAQDPVQGRDAIREMFAGECASAEMVCVVGNLYEGGEVAILEWRDPVGPRGCDNK